MGIVQRFCVPCVFCRGCSPSFGGSGPFAALSMPGGDPASKGMAEKHCNVFLLR